MRCLAHSECGLFLMYCKRKTAFSALLSSLNISYHLMRPVILDHDGGVDDLVALALLLASVDDVQVIGCVVLDADCYVKDAYSVSGKLAALMRRKDPKSRIAPFPIAMSTLGGVHPFPHDWRVDARKMDDLPCMNIPRYAKDWEADFGCRAGEPGEELLARLVMEHKSPVTVCVTGPLTNVAFALEKYGSAFSDNIDQIIIMGGAVDVGGNVFVDGTDRSAEWNIYWDAPSAKKVLESSLLCDKCVLFSLDATNHVPVHSKWVQTFGALYGDGYALADFIGSSWAQCTHLELLGGGAMYYAWDVLTAAYAIDPTIAKRERVTVRVHTEKGSPSEGRTERIATQQEVSNVSEVCPVTVWVAKEVDVEKFYSMVYEAAKFV